MKRISFSLIFRIAANKSTFAYAPTHIRMSSWLIGIIAGYMITEYPKDSIPTKTVPHLAASHCVEFDLISFNFSVHLAFVPDIRFRCIGLLICRNSYHNVELVSARTDCN